MNQRRKKKNWLEWTVFTMGLVLVCTVIGYLTYDIWTDRSGPADVRVAVGVAKQRGEQYVMPVEVSNQGQEVAEQVHVEVELRDGTVTEKANFVVQFLPRGATRRGSVTFTVDPSMADRVTARVLGYELP